MAYMLDNRLKNDRGLKQRVFGKLGASSRTELALIDLRENSRAVARWCIR